MKCPYRKKVQHYKGKSDGAYTCKHDDDVEQFEDCYGKECPAYIEETYGGKVAKGCKFVLNCVPLS